MEPRVIGGRYEVVRSIGTGGMAEVVLAHDLNLHREVAVKVLRPQFSTDPEFQDQFLREARSAANLAHPNIVTIHDFGQDPDQLYIVMEYVDGTDLKSLIRRKAVVGHEQAVDIMIQIAEGVGYAHRAGLVHCDLKPQNVLVSNSQRVKIADFGISQALATLHPDETHNIVWGSPQYFSPEQAAGSPPSPASDVYSLGVILYEMLTGQLPFDGANSTELALQHQKAPVVPPSLIVPTVPPSLDQITLKVLSKEPAGRYRTADQFGRVLKTFGGGWPQLPIDIDAATRAFERVVPDEVDWLAVGLGLLAFIAVGGLVPLWLWVWLLYQ